MAHWDARPDPRIGNRWGSRAGGGERYVAVNGSGGASAIDAVETVENPVRCCSASALQTGGGIRSEERSQRLSGSRAFVPARTPGGERMSVAFGDRFMRLHRIQERAAIAAGLSGCFRTDRDADRGRRRPCPGAHGQGAAAV